MANETHTINSCKSIELRDNVAGITHEIKKVVYCDGHGTPHIVWPCRAELTDIYLVDITDNWTEYHYTYDNGSPSPRMIPNHDYAVKGTIKVYEAPGVLEATMTDCYFFHETLEYPDGDNDPYTPYWFTGDNGTARHPSVNPKVTDKYGNTTEISASHGYNVYRVSDTSPGGVRGYSLQLGFYNSDSYGYYVQNGFVFDEMYQTPIVVKRDDIRQSVGFYLTNTDNPASAQVQREGNNLQPGDTITFYPKFHKYGVTTNWETLEDITFEHMEYDTTRFNVTKEGNSYIIAVKDDAAPTTVTSDLKFYTKYDAEHEEDCEYEEISIDVVPDVFYLVKIGQDSITGTTFTITTPVTLNASKTLSVYKDATFPPSFGNDTLYNSNTQLSSSNGTIVSCSGRTITAGNPGTATITVTVDGVELPSFEVTVPQTIPTIYYKVSEVKSDIGDITYPSYEGSTELTTDSNFTRNTYDASKGVAYFKIKFGTDSLLNNTRTVYIDTDGEGFIECEDNLGNTISVYASGDNEWILYFYKVGTSSDNTFTVDLPVYAWDTNEGLDGFIGTIHLTLKH